MAITCYSIEARNAEGSLMTGLTPTVNSFKREADNANLTGVTLTFTETVPGLYKFYYDPIVSGEAFLQVDLGATVPASSRFVNMQLTLDTTNNLLGSIVDGTITVRQALKAFLAVLVGNSVGSTTQVEFKAQDNTTTLVTGTGFNGNGSRTITKGSL